MLNSDGMDIHQVSAFCDTDLTYIKNHYYHPDLLSPEILDKLDKGHQRQVKKIYTIRDIEPTYLRIDGAIREFSQVL